ncbi:DUF2125 domain-containing protein [Aliiroseovarius sp. PrR006]|uniref:DUF2125 domain-containing protein n=1 Tax=Aliiroseovarius sp. PrR006 TaxID=2706883 RepID=UPI0013D58F2E|nr:DUF2125 domain-containing protein [Aliiroseovarius sp. PrR006]NDW54446.1 DUF2125 domain-containing protein [Aliiroseovarius sp. PrR006]
MQTLATRLTGAAILGAAFLPGTAFADLSTGDVWTHLQQSSSVFGGALSAETSTRGEGLALQNVTFDMTLPFDVGSVSLDLGAFDLIDMGDGRVEMIVPENSTYTLTYSGTDGESFGGAMTMTHQGFTNIFSGSPEEITFDQKAARLDIAIELDDVPEEVMGFSMNGTYLGLVGQSVTKSGEMTTSDITFAADEQNITFNQSMMVDDEGPITAASVMKSGRIEGEMRMVTPSAGIDFTNLAKALREGLVMDMTTRMADYSTEQVTSQGDTLMMAQSSSARSYDSSMKLDASGVTISGPAEDFRLQMEMPMMPGLALGGNIASMSATMQAPLLADDSFGPVAFNLDLNGLTLDDMVWAMGDPMGALPRDPIHLTLDLTGTLKHNVEWLDFANLETNIVALGDRLPVEPGSATLNALRLSAVGAEITGEGAFTFDATDLETFNGMPRPEGKLTLRAKGLFALSPKLVEMGIPAEQVAQSFAMLQMFTTDDFDKGGDTHMTTIEITPDGSVFANGMQLQ